MKVPISLRSFSRAAVLSAFGRSFYGKTGFTGAAVIVGFCGAARPTPATSPKNRKRAYREIKAHEDNAHTMQL